MIQTLKNQKRMKANPEADDLSNPMQVWEDGEMTPSVLDSRTGMLGQVADAGDLGESDPSPYTLEVQEEILSQKAESMQAQVAIPKIGTLGKTGLPKVHKTSG